MKYTLFSLLFLPLLYLPAMAQEDTTNPRSAELHALAWPAGDSVVLRWGPTTPGAWIIANRTGYMVERRRVTDDGDVRVFERLTAEPLVPWTVEEWKRRSRPEQKFAAIALQCLHGKAHVPASDHSAVRQLRLAADELMNRYSFALFSADNDAHAANGLALRFVDRDIEPGATYAYRIFTAQRDTSYSIDTAYVVVEAGPAPAIPPPPELTAEELDSLIVLRWHNTPGDAFSGFYVERSDDGGATYRRLNEIPIVPMTPEDALQPMTPRYDDSTITNYRRYRYRVRGVTAFAELSQPAETEAMGRDRTPPPVPHMQKARIPATTAVVLQWDMDQPPADLAGFVVARSALPEQGFHTLFDQPLPASARSFLDTAATADEPYYMVGAVDTAGNVAPSLPVYADLIDTMPPAVPTGLTGTIDTSGIVTLRWNPGIERDLLGYRVLWANDSTHEFSQRTPAPWQDTVFVDSISVRTLTPYVYYRLAAVDTRYLHSEATAVLALKRPDIVPPEPSVFTDVSVTDTSVQLHWEHSRSEDVAVQMLERRVQNSGNTWQELVRLPARQQQYTDTAVQRRTVYEYRVTAIDSAGHRSQYAFSVTGRPYDTGRRSGIDALQATLSPDKRSVALSWRYTPSAERYWFIVYRSYNGTPLRQYKAVESGVTTFEDGLLAGDGTYRYAVRVKMHNGAESDVSEPAVVEVRTQ